MGAIPQNLISSLRAGLASQGIAPGTIKDSGDIDPVGLLAGAYDTIEFRSRLTPPVKAGIGVFSGPPSLFAKFLQPTVIFSGGAGRFAVAPYGEANPWLGWGLSLAIFSGVFMLGVMLGKSRR